MNDIKWQKGGDGYSMFLYLFQEAISIPKLQKILDILAELYADFLVRVFNEVD